MIEPIMYLAIGFLVSMLFGLMIVPLVHNRAVRLTTRRLEAATPLSMAEIQADKDQLRAEFAMSARRLEMSVDQLKNKTTSQLAELGKKTDAINRMKIELGEKNATIFSLEAREKAMKEQLRATEEEFAAKTELLRGAEAALNDKQAELGKINHELSDRSMMADTRQVELIAVRTQIEQLKGRVRRRRKAHFRTDASRAADRAGASRRFWRAHPVLELAKTCSIGLRSGEYGGRYHSLAPAFWIIDGRTATCGYRDCPSRRCRPAAARERAAVRHRRRSSRR